MSPEPPAPDAAPGPCPLCGESRPRRRIATIPYAAIWEALETQWEARVPAETARRLTPAPATALVECGRCRLGYFTPALPGDREYYAALAASPRYYVPWKWEFGWVRDRLAPGAAVLDVGCGAGDFLAAVAPRLGRAVGLETSPAAAAAARARGLEVEVDEPAAFARRRAGAFDAVCLFHVLEHLPAVLPTLRACLACLRPGGTLYVSVPHRGRAVREPLEPLDCPPHHLSRWAPRQLSWAATAAGAVLAQLACEPASPEALRIELPRRARSALAKVPGAGAWLGRQSTRVLDRTVLHRSLLPRYARGGVFRRLGLHGMSVVAALVRPARQAGGGP